MIRATALLFGASRSRALTCRLLVVLVSPSPYHIKVSQEKALGSIRGLFLYAFNSQLADTELNALDFLGATLFADNRFRAAVAFRDRFREAHLGLREGEDSTL